MPGLRSRRLEQLLDGPINETLTYAQVKRLIPNTIEGPDLDFKRDTYGNGDRDRKALSTDVAALANAGGGILVLGLGEDEQGRAADAVGVPITDDERRRLRQTVYSNVQPAPSFDVIPVEDPDRPGIGFLVIWVARSAGTPHAYIQNKSLLYPKRIGTETVYLSEAEVAQAYRARFAGLSDRIAEAVRLEGDFIARLDSDQVWLVSTLVPDLPGDFRIDTAAVKDFQSIVQDKAATGIGLPLWSFARAGVRHRRLVAAGNYEADRPYSSVGCELHENGSGTFAVRLGAWQRNLPGIDDNPVSRINDEETVRAIAATLQFLALHARDRAAAGGFATVRITVYPVTLEAPVYLTHNRNHGLDRDLGMHPAVESPIADTTADLDELAAPGTELLAVTYRLATGLFQEFGRPEALQLTADGKLRRQYWGYQTSQAVSRWAEANSVDLIDEVVG